MKPLEEFTDAELFLNRELSQLAFNFRVLEQARDESMPLLERLKYLCISCTNLDEFFEIRAATVKTALQYKAPLLPDNMDPQLALERIYALSNKLVHEQYALWNETLRPEFDVTRAYNPRSVLLAVARVGGMSFTALGTDGALLSGQGGVMRLDGGYEPIAGRRLPYISIGAGKLGQSGASRAAQFMLLEQAFNEAKAPTPGDERLLTGQGRNALNQAMASQRFLVSVNREADIRQVLKLAQKYGIRVALVGASEAWRVAEQLAAANIPVFIDAMEALPSGFDQLGSTEENAARLQRAGVSVSFINGNDGSHNARKLRQIAGNAVANGLPWQAGLAGITSAPAKALGVDAQVGSIEIGKSADLVLWTGDPLDVASTATAMWLQGRETPLVSRQTLLRDRYLAPANGMPRAYQP